MEKKWNLQGRVVWLWVRLPPSHTTMETLGWWNAPVQVGQHWAQQKLENLRSEVELDKYWVSLMLSPNNKIILVKNLILLGRNELKKQVLCFC